VSEAEVLRQEENLLQELNGELLKWRQRGRHGCKIVWPCEAAPGHSTLCAENLLLVGRSSLDEA